MNNSLKNVLQFAGSYLNDELVSSESIFQMSQIANLLPTIPAVSEAVLECHLGSSAPRTDFSISFTPLNQGREALTGYCEPLANLLCTNPVWNRVRDFCACWADIESPLYKNVAHIWLEFDLDRQASEVPEPSFFFYPISITGEEEKLSLTKNISLTKNWVTDEALRLLLGNSLPEQVKKNVLICFNALPASGEVYQIGVMLPRKSESQAVRLCVKGITPEQILEYLRSIGWSDSISQLSYILSELSSFVDVIMLSFSVEKNVHSKIGFECYFDKQPQNSSRWHLFLDYLIKHQLCTLEEAKALLKWSGYSIENCNQELWPSNFTKASAFVGTSFKSTIIRLLNHIKIVYEPHQPLQAKAYLWLGHRWFSPSILLEK
ncbi:hypothetical protein [Brasilonema sp. UFV-L1]|uniref:hypothetical protein n=1 Tax=Brasilonema sp. UFV-L1 TaxID=2234130 RepID=UPI00145D3F63|nr:hypothetical protein [Brasilonema sp. UFV-L1]NMG07810.1 hypothetical protein [Brasilonema sp. UFV-L1]